MKTLPATSKGGPDFTALNQWDSTAIYEWIVERLHGRDRHWVPRQSEGETWHELIVDAYSHRKTTDESRRRIRESIVTLGAHLGRSHASFKQPAAIENYLDLVPQILEDRDKRATMTGYLRRMIEKLPWISEGHDLRASCVQCLLDLGFRGKPKFWRRLWNSEHPEIAGLIFSGILKEDPREAFRWFGSVRPWNEDIMMQVLDLHWAHLLYDFNNLQLANWMEEDVMRFLEPTHALTIHGWILGKKKVNVRIPFEVSSKLGRLIRIGGHSVVDSGRNAIVYCDSLNHLDDVKVMAEAFSRGKAYGVHAIGRTPVESLPTILHHIIRGEAELKEKMESRDKHQDLNSPLTQLKQQERLSLSFARPSQSP